MNRFSFHILSIALLIYSCVNNKTHYSNIAIDNKIISDSLIVKFYMPFKKNLDNSLMNKPISYSKKNYKKNDGELNSSLSNLFADATYEMTNQIFNNISGENLDMVLLNNGGIRSIISKGPISEKTAYELMPFENSIVVVKLKGSSIKKMINYLSKSRLAHPINGLNIILNKDYSLNSAKINGENINNTKTYNVATTDYLLNGGDKMYFLSESISTVNLNYKMRNVLIDYFRKVDTLKLIIDNRFIIK